MPMEKRKFVLKAGWKSTHLPGVGMVHPGKVLVGEQFAKFLPNILTELFEPASPVISDPPAAQGAVPGGGAATAVAVPPAPPKVIVPPAPAPVPTPAPATTPPPPPPPPEPSPETPVPEAAAEEEAPKPQMRRRKK